MSKIFIVNTILTSDVKHNKSYVLSTKEDKVELPVHSIVSPRHLFNETRYIVKNYFDKESIQFLEEIVISSSELQNEFVFEYLNSIKEDSSQYDIEKDIFILNSIVLHNKLRSVNLHWCSFSYDSEEKMQNPLFAIIDTTIQKSLV